jgi:hypothetical protein
MCNKSGETLDHLLHCDVARDLWIMVFQMFGVEEWIMPRWVVVLVDLLACWKRRVGWDDINIVWNVILPFLIWCIWRGRNA